MLIMLINTNIVSHVKKAVLLVNKKKNVQVVERKCSFIKVHVFIPVHHISLMIKKVDAKHVPNLVKNVILVSVHNVIIHNCYGKENVSVNVQNNLTQEEKFVGDVLKIVNLVKMPTLVPLATDC